MKLIRRATLVAISMVVLAPQAGAATRADLTVTKLSEPPAGVQPGAALAVTDAVRNAGRAKARKSTVVYWLSTDRRKNAGDVRAGRRSQKALKGRRTARGRTTLTLPASLPAGAYHLVACADGGAKVKESNERNNCRASRGRLAITALALPGAPALPAPGATTTPGPAPEPTATATPEPTATATPTPTPTPGGPTPPPPNDDTTGEPFPKTADPISVTHTLETGNAVTKRATGGQFATNQIVATAANGTKYTLDIPAGALVSDVDITMTPVSAVTGSPLDGALLGAVEILPHGLELLKPATLTIEPAGDAGPISGQTGFLSHDAGEDFHLYPLAMGSALKLHLTHFSTPGVSQSSDAGRQPILGKLPERYRAQYEQAMAELLREARADFEADPENATMPADEMAEILRGYYNHVVWPLVEQAYTDDAVASRAISELLSWARQVDLLSLDEHPRLKVPRGVVFDNIEVILDNAIKKGYLRCVDEHDLDYVARLVGLARAAALLGLTLGDEAFDKAQRCANFEFRFDSLVVETSGYVADDGRTAQTDGRYRVNMSVEIPFLGLTQTGKLRYTEFSYQQVLTYPCGSSGGELRYVTTGTSTTDDNAVTLLLGMDLNPREPETPPPADRDIRVRMFQFGDGFEMHQRTAPTWCGDTPPQPEDPTKHTRWRDAFDTFHTDSIFEDWTLEGTDLIATKQFDNARPTWGLTETTRLELWHKPLK